MNNYTFGFIVFLIGFLPSKMQAQDFKKPKVALVLSGGGAKGIAHIPLLQKLDSLGIVPDLIVGTSMGSVVGGFYAIGYSGDSIASITKNANWDLLLGGKTALNNVSVEEKSEFGKYLVDFDIKNGKPNIRPSLLNDQHLRAFFSVYTYPAYKILDFDRLPIAFRAIATDIVNGEEVVLKNGSLGVAMRASMSIPSIFKPVPYKDVLLVDGGILNNFPVDVAKNWGADIIIGSDVGGGMKPKEELEGITTILFQSAMLVSNKKNPESRKNCDILIDHLPYLTHATADFNKSPEIYKEGMLGTAQKLDALVALSERLKKYPKKEITIPIVPVQIALDTVIYKGINKDNLELVRSRTGISSHNSYSVDQLVGGVNRAMGTTLFNQITTQAIQKNGLLGIEITGQEHANNQIRTSLHYDTYRGTGLIANYTGRNVLGNSSRILITADIAVQPRFRIQYQKQFGKNRSWWWRSDILGEFLNQDVFINGDFAEEVRYQYSQFDNEINRNLQPLTSYLGLGLNYESSIIKPKSDPEIIANTLALKRYFFDTIDLDAHFVFNSLNAVFFAARGALIKAKVTRSIYNSVDAKPADELETRVEGKTNGFTKFSASFEKRFPIQEKLTLTFNTHTNFIFQDAVSSDEVLFQDFGFGSKYFLGGNLISPREGSIVFPGLRENQLAVNQFIKIHMSFQYNPTNNVFITPHINYATVGFGAFENYLKDVLLPDGRWTERIETSSLFSAGTTLSYNSLLGPVNFDVSWVNDINKLRFFFSFGLFLNLAD